jgi:tripartite-type tricarboxylate transporter receptor subunit TctC
MDRLRLTKILGACCSVFFMTLIIIISPAWCASYPAKTISLVTTAPGGTSDAHARILAEIASKDLGVPIIIVNKPGPGGVLAATFVSNEKPDGYTFLVTQSGTFTSNFAVFPNLSYTRADFTPAFMSIIVPANIGVRADSPYKTLKDFLDGAKKNPGKLRSGSTSPSISIIWEGLLRGQGLDVTHLMYKGGPDVVLALMGGHIDCAVDSLTPMLSHVESGQLRPVASISSKRNKNYPNVPTLHELGYSFFSRDLWNGFFGPANLPPLIAAKFVSSFEKALALPNVQERLEKVGTFANFMGPKEFPAFIEDEYKFYMGLAKQKK